MYMTITGAASSESLLAANASDLDIPDDLHEKAVVKYTEVGEWLAADDSELQKYSPEIYPQGSFRLGTAIRPFHGNGEYDIDLVCRLDIRKEQVTQKELKDMIGRRLRAHDEYKTILVPCRRCWRLTVSTQFHLDVLPSIPNIERPPTGILLTDKDLFYWQCSNPVAYADWFYTCMRVRAEESGTIKASVEDVPEWRVRTPLQRTCQLLKRHRDIYFSADADLQPVSIIITTLAARSYRGEGRIVDAVRNVLATMASHIERRNDKWWIANPADPQENFADKWNETPEKAKRFYGWLEAAKRDFEGLIAAKSLEEQRTRAGSMLRPSERIQNASVSNGELTPLVPALVESVPGPADEGHRRREPWQPDLRYKAKATGKVYTKLGSKPLWALTDRAVSKNLRLWFDVETNAPRPFDVHWQVLNTGEEARRANQLRGDFYPPERSGGTGRWESTLYAGTHWIQAHIIKDGVCVARSEKKYVRVRS